MAEAESGGDSVLGLVWRALEDPQAEGRHGDAVVEREDGDGHGEHSKSVGVQVFVVQDRDPHREVTVGDIKVTAAPSP